MPPPSTSRSVSRSTGGGRWPSTESISKILDATKSSLEDFLEAVNPSGVAQRALPLIGFAQAGAGGFFDDGGLPTGEGWDAVPFPR